LRDPWDLKSRSLVLSWSGPDLRPAIAGDSASIVYGMLPPGLFRIVRERFLALHNERRVSQVRRTP